MLAVDSSRGCVGLRDCQVVRVATKVVRVVVPRRGLRRPWGHCGGIVRAAGPRTGVSDAGARSRVRCAKAGDVGLAAGAGEASGDRVGCGALGLTVGVRAVHLGRSGLGSGKMVLAARLGVADHVTGEA